MPDFEAKFDVVPSQPARQRFLLRIAPGMQSYGGAGIPAAYYPDDMWTILGVDVAPLFGLNPVPSMGVQSDIQMSIWTLRASYDFIDVTIAGSNVCVSDLVPRDFVQIGAWEIPRCFDLQLDMHSKHGCQDRRYVAFTRWITP